MKYVDVVIDNNSDHTDELYTYGCEFDEVKVGDKVYVPFARGNKRREGYVFTVREQLEEPIRGLKNILEIDPEVSLPEEAVETCVWMKRRYLCKYIDGVKCFTPAGSSSKRGKKRDPLAEKEYTPDAPKELNPEQKAAMEQIRTRLSAGEHRILLIQGVTGSGKTEVYLQAIEEVVNSGRQAIMMVPEISLTPQTIQRFLSRFGKERTAVLHSKLSLGQRYDEWMRIRKGEASIVIGARSAVFAPLSNPGIIILDEEHETSYKSDKTPKYDAFEVAVKRMGHHKGLVVLGSATPSVVNAYRSRSGLFDLIRLEKRYNETQLPEVSIVDMREELKQGNHTMFSVELVNTMEATLSAGRQVILFLNRRGYSTFVSCRNCGYTVTCPDCGITMTYHKNENACVCHFCGKKQPMLRTCPECGSSYIRHFGTGTEQVEETVRQFFGNATVARLDLDTVRTKGSIDKILKDFQKGKTQILVGTQLVAKGLDFANVGLVGIISADVTLNIPDFRSAERTFQLVTQAAGRSGRGDERGKVIIQTYSPDNYAVVAASHQDYEEFYEQELVLRRQLGYPPFCDLYQLVVAGEREEEVHGMAQALKDRLRSQLGDQASILGPGPAPMYLVNGTYRMQILMKAPAGTRKEYSQAVVGARKQLFMDKKQECLLHTDINPFSFI